MEGARLEGVVYLACHRCGEYNEYRIGQQIRRGCQYCCCDWFVTAEECPTVERVSGVITMPEGWEPGQAA